MKTLHCLYLFLLWICFLNVSKSFLMRIWKAISTLWHQPQKRWTFHFWALNKPPLRFGANISGVPRAAIFPAWTHPAGQCGPSEKGRWNAAVSGRSWEPGLWIARGTENSSLSLQISVMSSASLLIVANCGSSWAGDANETTGPGGLPACCNPTSLTLALDCQVCKLCQPWDWEFLRLLFKTFNKKGRLYYLNY